MPINKIEQTRLQLIKEGRKIINLSSANPVESGIIFPEKILARGFKKLLQSPHYQPDPKGSLTARKAISSWYKKRNFSIDPNQILLTSGTSESYFHLFKLLAKPGEQILFPSPGYPLFDHIANLAEISLNYYQLDPKQKWQVNIPNLQSKITPQTKAIVLISPNNPTGGILSLTNLKAIIQLAERHKLAIISDEVFSEFIFDGKLFPRVGTLSKKINIFTLNGISKTYALPGLKLSWIAVTGPATATMVDELELFTDTFLACNQISQTLLPDIMNYGTPFLKKYQKLVQKNRDLAVEILSTSPYITFQKPEGGFYLFAKIHNFPGSDEDLTLALLKKYGIFVHPGYFYDYEDSHPHILISYFQEPKILEASLKKIIYFLEHARSDSNRSQKNKKSFS